MGNHIQSAVSAVIGGDPEDSDVPTPQASTGRSEGPKPTPSPSPRPTPPLSDPAPAMPSTDSPEGGEVEWAWVLGRLRAGAWAEVAAGLSRHPPLAQALLRLDDGGAPLEHRVALVIHQQYFEAVRDEDLVGAGRWAQLYRHAHNDRPQALTYLLDHSANRLNKLAAQLRDQLALGLTSGGGEAPDGPQAASAPKGPVLQALSLPSALAGLFDGAMKQCNGHAYAEEAFDGRASLLLLRHLQPLVQTHALAFLHSWLQVKRIDLYFPQERERRAVGLPSGAGGMAEVGEAVEDLALASHYAQWYLRTLRRQYERSVEFLGHQGFSFVPGSSPSTSVDDGPATVALLASSDHSLDLSLYIREPLLLYIRMDDLTSRVYPALESHFLALSLTNTLVSAEEDGETGVGTSAGVDLEFLLLRRMAERALQLGQTSASAAAVGVLGRFVCGPLRGELLRRLRSALGPTTPAAASAPAPHPTRPTNSSWFSSLTSMVSGTTSPGPASTATGGGTPSSGLGSPGGSKPSPPTASALPAPKRIAMALNDLVVVSGVGGASGGATGFLAKLAHALRALTQRNYKSIDSASLMLAIEEFERLVGVAYAEGVREAVGLVLAPFAVPTRRALQTFASTSYEIDPTTLKEFEVNDPWARMLIGSFEEFYAPIREHLVSEASSEVVLSAVASIANGVESVVGTKRFTYCGGLQLESDLRTLVKYFSSLQGRVREAFGKLKDMASFLAVEKVADIGELWNDDDSDEASALLNLDPAEFSVARVQIRPTVPRASSERPSKWKITTAEVRTLLARRVDLNPALLDRLKLK